MSHPKKPWIWTAFWCLLILGSPTLHGSTVDWLDVAATDSLIAALIAADWALYATRRYVEALRQRCAWLEEDRNRWRAAWLEEDRNRWRAAGRS